MLKTEGEAWRRLPPLLAGCGLMLAFGAAVSAQGRGFALPRQGFEATAQNPANYTPEEAAAVALILKWIDTTNNHDTPAHMALVGDNAAYRGDPLEPLRRGAEGYCAAFGFVGSRAWFGLNELYVVGGPSDTLVLMRRTDINSPYNGAGILGGYPVPLAVMLRVQNGKLVEWYDMPDEQGVDRGATEPSAGRRGAEHSRTVQALSRGRRQCPGGGSERQCDAA